MDIFQNFIDKIKSLQQKSGLVSIDPWKSISYYYVMVFGVSRET